MKLTPLDIRHKEFRRAMRGYSDEEVDVFLDEVADEFERLFQENMELRERVEQLVEQVQQHELLKETLQKTLVSAQQQSDEMRANARKEAELIIKDAEIKGRDLLGESYVEKQRVQQSLIQLKQMEEDFKFKFRSLLEAHISLLPEDAGLVERRGARSSAPARESEEERSAEVSSPGDEVEYIGLREPPTRGDFLEDLEREVVGSEPKAESEALNELDVGLEREVEQEIEAQPELEEALSPEPGGGAHPEEETEVENKDAVLVSSVEPGDGVTGDFPGSSSARPSVVDDDTAASPSADEGEDAADEAPESSGGQRDSSVRRFLFGRKDKPSDESDFFDGPEDRDFQW